eukprot:COSAG05_NODE_6270_length_987_cov_1.497748_2_plen_165_part_00
MCLLEQVAGANGSGEGGDDARLARVHAMTEALQAEALAAHRLLRAKQRCAWGLLLHARVSGGSPAARLSRRVLQMVITRHFEPQLSEGRRGVETPVEVGARLLKEGAVQVAVEETEDRFRARSQVCACLPASVAVQKLCSSSSGSACSTCLACASCASCASILS